MVRSLFGKFFNWKILRIYVPNKNGPLKNQQPQLWKFITKSSLMFQNFVLDQKVQGKKQALCS
jgi:hypothetical protein